MAEWQPIKTAPTDGREILGWIPSDRPCFPSGGFCQVCTYLSVGGGWCWSDQDDAQPTHWMPLPEPPRDSVAERTTEDLWTSVYTEVVETVHQAKIVDAAIAAERAASANREAVAREEGLREGFMAGMAKEYGPYPYAGWKFQKESPDGRER